MDKETRRITIKEASRMMQVTEQHLRVSISAKKIPGAYYLEGRNGKRRTYFITEAQVKNMMEGKTND